VNFEAGRGLVPEQATDTAAIDKAAAASIRTDLRMETGRIITSPMQQLARDMRLAMRRLRASPGFTLFAVTSLALGIGVSTAIYSAVRTLLWMPLGIPKAGELIVVHNPRTFPAMSWLDFRDMRGQQTTCRAVAAAVTVRTALRAANASETVFGGAVSGDYFSVIEVRARLGRLLHPQDETSMARVVVVSEAFWRTRLHADPAIVGQRLTLGGAPFEIVGVVSGTFRGLELVLPQAFWIPVTVAAAAPGSLGLTSEVFTARATRDFAVWARARPNISIAQVTAEMTVIGQRLDAAYPLPVAGPRTFTRDWEAHVAGQERRRGREFVQTIVTAILVAVAVVLLIACTNLANLSLARGTARAQEVAVRTALGASRWRIVREQMIESAVVVTLGGVLSAFVLLRLMDYFTLDLPFGRGMTVAFTPQLDGTVLAFAIVSMVTALALFGVWPALQSTRVDVRRGLGAGSAATPAKWRLHRGLITWQVCGSVALLLVAVMSVRIIRDPLKGTLTPRFDDLAVAQIDFALNGADEARTRRALDSIVAQLRDQPGILSVSATNGSPNSFEGQRLWISRTEDAFRTRPETAKAAGVSAVDRAFLSTLGVPMLRGRPFTERDDAGAPRVAIVTEELARELFQTTDVVGRTVAVTAEDVPVARSAAQPLTVVGVTRDMQISPTALRPDRLLFVPFAQRYEPRAPIMILARASDPAAAVGLLRSVTARVDPDLVLSAVGTGSVLLEGPFFLFRVIALLAGALGALALVLAMAGLFGILSHVVEQRTREIGIRLAIGADRMRIVRLVLRDGVHPVMRGLVLGLAIGVGSRLVLRGQLFTSVAAWDPIEFVGVPLLFVIAAVIACAIPAFRASRVDPNVALRDL
jgi:predicted permease